MNNKRNGLFRNSLFYIVIFLSLIGIIYFFSNGQSNSQSKELQSSEFISQLRNNKIKDFSVQPNNGVYKITGDYRKAQKVSSNSGGFGLVPNSKTSVKSFTTVMLDSDSQVAQVVRLAEKNNIKMDTKAEESSGFWIQILLYALPLVMIIFFFYMMMGQAGQGGGNNRVMNFGKSKVKPADKKANKVRFSDVAGAEEEKQELVEVVEFLKDPRKFVSLGARIPAGVLLEGPPGTGKTLLAKAVAGEAGVPFYSISGSDFVEMFVGVGASRVRDLFEQAKKSAPAIIFIDEIDAVGRKRGNGMGGGHDEREQTLNQLLVELDGFTGSEGVIVIAATNRSDVLDPALLRPGRFDRKILVGSPDVKGREAILKVHAKNKPLADDVDLKVLAKTTPGFVGADLENLLNEAALVAARRDKKKIDAADVDEAEDRVIAGPAKRDRVISPKERNMVAFHEAGHTIVGLVLSDSRVVRKVTIVPRGRAGGYAIMLPREDQFLMTKKELTEQIVGLLGGRTAEEIIFGTQSTGASNDFEQATQLARAMVTQYGMSAKLGDIQYEGPAMQQTEFGVRPYSEATATAIDDEVRRIMNEAHQQAYEIIQAHRDQHKLIAEELLKRETLNEKQILSLFNTGEMPDEAGTEEFPSEKAATFEQSKQELERQDAEKQVKDKQNTDGSDSATAQSDDSAATADSTAADSASAQSDVASNADSADSQSDDDHNA
ncbi:ATP-dependent zinc metalloprotease FtsH [Loigolactobacillus coryniformis]|jgi:cell division protease FtsH|uniref:ATP-dependent zinc metalloprotease FtsH n=2 Tax=Loigolactobacillus coryniformis TaxID=1610 RepID=A0A0R1EZY3_9LACO|nr:ATP-dependent zinc metalloprotease FtsH [Loigolactobacillus coryniformis]OEH90774.1 cell division protein FtsH [Loigolactobacillus coryniformis subsp. coryniformis]RRG04217.1 MAG: ATP-dependent metallopeptidase FtsH/Yme1/Tma family protein [Lactobacillus sp.]ATO54663.1 cell division protein FtsH [Loigolactobacillus coryniformis subsp. coryniformis KCTC 3167 = DSM 20001]KRK15241.1 cell division protein FtsH, ATP-dependent zinc metallopeptidase [Loigolactobacillus coryniformis subsp. corynifor